MSNKCVHEWYYRIVDIVSWQFFCIRCGEKLSMDKFSNHASDLEKNADALTARIAELSQAVGLITTMKPTMVMDANHPLDMVREVGEHVNARIAELKELLDTESQLSNQFYLLLVDNPKSKKLADDLIEALRINGKEVQE